MQEMLADVCGGAAVGEISAVWVRGFLENRRCSCGANFRTCEFWRSVVSSEPAVFSDATAERVRDLYSKILRPATPLRIAMGGIPLKTLERRAGSWYREAAEALYRAVAETAGVDMLVDSSKSPVLAWIHSRLGAVRLRLVHLVRDPRAVAHSWQRKVQTPEGVQPLPTMAPWKSAVSWVFVNTGAVALRRELGVVRVRYEDLAAWPEETLRRILLELGVAVEGLDLRLTEVRPTSVDAHVLQSNPRVRFASGPLKIGLDTEWESAMGFGAKGLVSAITAPLLPLFGYRIRPKRS